MWEVVIVGSVGVVAAIVGVVAAIVRHSHQHTLALA
jgi:hypothetical protein